MTKTSIPEPRLVEIRATQFAAAQTTGRFINPREVHQVTQILDRRGESWAAAVLGRDLNQRSLAVPRRPFLKAGECGTLIAADTEEDRAAVEQMETGLT
jgi:hypothetical protein